MLKTAFNTVIDLFADTVDSILTDFSHAASKLEKLVERNGNAVAENLQAIAALDETNRKLNVESGRAQTALKKINAILGK